MSLDETDLPGWIICQLGAREHYVLARALHAAGRLDALVTDIWAARGSVSARLPGALGRRVRERHVEGLDDARVEHFTTSALINEVGHRVAGTAPMAWSTIMKRNAWFQRQAVARLKRSGLLRSRPIVFAYSYAARDILQTAKAAGCMTVLGQIDPAVTEEKIVAEAIARHGGLKPDWDRAPRAYWEAWREECEIADRVVVNSPWARDGLIAAGIGAEKLRVVPLAYEGSRADNGRSYPARFDAARPLRLLFLGSLIVRKGLAELIEATRLLRDAPIEFHLVGPAGISFPEDVVADPNVHLHGPVQRGLVDSFYAQADAFILPSLSDGFGLTMLEAMARGLPVIASRRCGDVVTDNVDGVLLEEVSADAIVSALRGMLADPAALTRMSREALARSTGFAPSVVRDRLVEVVDRH